MQFLMSLMSWVFFWIKFLIAIWTKVSSVKKLKVFWKLFLTGFRSFFTVSRNSFFISVKKIYRPVKRSSRISNYQQPAMFVLDFLEQEENRVHDRVRQVRVLKNDRDFYIFTASKKNYLSGDLWWGGWTLKKLIEAGAPLISCFLKQ